MKLVENKKETLLNINFFSTILVLILSSLIIFMHYDYFILMNDDYFVLSERVFFPNEAILEWLNHLLFFNQTRYTWVGDISLFRPGLFFLQWLYFEILFPINPKLVTMTISIFNLFSLMGVFFAIKKYTNIFFGIFAVISLSLIDRGSIAYFWAHINPYILSIGLFSWWLAFYNKSTPWAVLLLFLSTLLYDIFGIFLISLGFLLIIKSTIYYINKKSFNLEHKPILLFSIIYIFFRLLIINFYTEVDSELTNSFVSYFNNISPNWNIALKNFFIEFFKRASFNIISKDLIPFFVVFIAILLGISFKNYYRKIDWIFLFSPIIFVTLFIFVLVSGRVVVRGNYGDWYIIYIHFCALCIWSSIFQHFKANKIIWSVFLILISLSNIKNFYNVSIELREKKMASPYNNWNKIHKIISNSDSNRCLTGFIPQKSKNTITDPWKGISTGLEELPFREYYILFRTFFCDGKNNKVNPFYITTNFIKYDEDNDELKNFYETKFIESDVRSNDYISNLKGFSSSITPKNYFERWKSKTFLNSKNKYLFVARQKNYKIRIKSSNLNKDKFYNIAVSFKNKLNGLPFTIISLIDNDVLIWSKNNISNKYELTGVGIIPNTSNHLDLEYKKFNDDVCLLKINDIIITATRKCPSHTRYIETFGLTNGTSSEQNITLLSFIK